MEPVLLLAALLLPPVQDTRLPTPVMVDEASYGGLTVMFNYSPDPGCAVDPLDDCVETLFTLYYPEGTGPTSLGYPQLPAAKRLPVLIGVHGGGTASSNLVPLLAWGFFRQEVTSYRWWNGPGFLGVETNYPPISVSNDVMNPATGTAYLVQWLRAHADALNLNPDAIVLWGRSYGGLITLVTGLYVDNQDPLSADPIEHQPSRPNVLLPFAALADLTCFADGFVPPAVVVFSFPEAMGADGTDLDKLLSSATWWVQHPEELGLDGVPPIGMGYALSTATACGQITNPHDGQMGYLMMDAIAAIPPAHRPPAALWDNELEIEIFSAEPKFEICLEWALQFLVPERKPGPHAFDPSPF